MGNEGAFDPTERVMKTVMSTKISGARKKEPVGRDAKARQPSLLQDIVALLIKIFIILTVFVLLLTFVFGFVTVKDMSMNPSLRDGDLVLFYRLSGDFVASDAVVVKYEGKTQVRRVIATAGDTVDITSEGLFINGAFIPEESEGGVLVFEGGASFPLTVPQGHVFVLADAQERSVDSRMYGAVSEQDILGRVTAVIRQRNI